MYHSGEIRWFYRGDAPAPLRRWIVAGDRGYREPRRIDTYLHLPGCDGTGVKLREGRFEIKARTSAPRPVSYARGIEGLRDGWVKWSRQADDGEALRRLVSDPHDAWLYVAKERRLRKFALEDHVIREVAGLTEMPAQGFQVELAVVRTVAGRLAAEAAAEAEAALRRAEAWWSLSVEAWGAPGEDPDHVDLGARYLFAEVNAVTLERRASMAYPAWLLERHGRGSPPS